MNRFRDELNRLTEVDAHLAAVRLYFARLADSHDIAAFVALPGGRRRHFALEKPNQRTTTMKRPKLEWSRSDC